MAQFGPVDLQTLLAQILQQNQEQTQAFMMQQPDGYSKVGAALGLGLNRLFGGTPEQQAMDSEIYKLNEQKNKAWEGVDLENPDQLRARAQELRQVNPALAMQFQQAAIQAEDLLLNRRLTEAQTVGAEVEAEVGKGTKDARIRSANSQAEANELEARFIKESFDTRLRSGVLSNQLTEAQIKEASERMATGPARTNLGRLMQEQDQYKYARDQYSPDSREYQALDQRVKEYQKAIDTVSLGRQTNIDGTDLTKTELGKVQTNIQQLKRMRDILGRLTGALTSPGGQVGFTAEIRRNLAGTLGSIVSEFDPARGEAVSRAIASDQQLTARTLARLVQDEYTAVLQRNSGRFTKEAKSSAEDLLQTLNTTTDDRIALEAITTLTGYIEDLYQEDLLRLSTMDVIPGEPGTTNNPKRPARASEDPEITGG